MITNEELDAIQLSATKKDFYQVWNEVLDTASKISERWDPKNTNESDPGIVLLKVLTACVDKLNYLIDVYALEDFMPSAAQMESMRKLCDMLGYNIKYYRSATTTAKISFNIPESASELNGFVTIDKFTNLKDIDDTVNYVTTEAVQISKDTSSVEVPCIEGELVSCETDDDNIISLLQLDDNNRYYLPEVQIAENGIFISSISDGYERETTEWFRVDNLNTQRIGQKCYKFGFDSRENLPYIQFPEDISNIIEDGIKIRYIRTNGVNGNISKNTLYKMEKPISWQATDTEGEEVNLDWEDVENYTVTNLSAARNGANIESLNDAYMNYKRTIGTFDTLVTCRDYMNKIYQLTVSDTDTIPLVSNIIVSDIRDDINKSNIICTFGPYGVEYNHEAKSLTQNATDVSTQTWQDEYVGHAGAANLNKLYHVVPDNVYYRGIFDGNDYNFAQVDEKKLNPFDLVFYPFKSVYGLNTKAEYVKSFKYSDSNILEIKDAIEEGKTLAHNIIEPNQNEIACIKNYYNLKATITTNRKVNILEQTDILNNIFMAIFENFNMRKLEFGEELVEDEIISVIENADPRIKNVGWQNPDIKMKICTVAGGEFGVSNTDFSTVAPTELAGDTYYNQLVLNNVLAGRISLFNYDENFKPEYNETIYPGYSDLVYPDHIDEGKTTGIAKIKTELTIAGDASDIKLHPNEVVQFRSKNLKTEKTYPAYVNYYLHLNHTTSNAIPATMQTLLNYLNGVDEDSINTIDAAHISLWNDAINHITTGISQDTLVINAESFLSERLAKHALFTLSGNTYSYAQEYTANEHYYYVVVDKNNVGQWQTWLKSKDDNLDFYYDHGWEAEIATGKLVDKDHHRYVRIKAWRGESDPFVSYYVPKMWPSTVEGEDGHTTDGLGQNAEPNDIPKDSEYELKAGEYILLNYTHATSTDSDNSKTVINEAYFAGDIIKPNFDLVDSTTYRSQHKYTKTSGYDYTDYGLVNPDGMFTLASDQQIEKRAFVVVKLDGFVNFYWTLNNEEISSNDRIMFPWDENQQGVDEYEQPFYTEYTLKDGEYFFYTNKDKTDIAYYGSGTKLTRTRETPLIYKLKSETDITAQDVAELGLSAAIPWRAYNLTKDTNNQEGIILTEYQYINLADGSTLVDFDIEGENINNNWETCSNAHYKISAESNETALPHLDITGCEWEIRSKLELNMGPVNAQTFYTTDKATSVISIYDKNGTLMTNEPISPLRNEPLSIKANKLIQSTTQVTNVGYTNVLDTEKQATYYDCQIKVFETQTLRDASNGTINLNNFGNGQFTKITFDASNNATIDGAFGSFNAIVPANSHFGLITLQYNKIGSGYNAGIRIIKSTVADDDPAAPYIYNYNSDNIWPDLEDGWGTTKIDTWATEGAQITNEEDFDRLKTTNTLYQRTLVATVATNNKYLHTYKDTATGRKYFKFTLVSSSATFDPNNVYYQLIDLGGKASDNSTNNTLYYLRKGINTICLTGPCTIQVFADQEKKDVIILGNLDLIFKDNPINPKLKYRVTEAGETTETQILKDIKALDPTNQFYYNVLINNELAIGLNPNDVNETLESPSAWYNYNNVNNKFVISEINAEYLSTGIVISQNSKL